MTPRDVVQTDSVILLRADRSRQPEPAKTLAKASLPAAGYSGTPLPQKLGFKDGQAALFVDLPAELHGLSESAAFARAEVIASWRGIATAAAPFDVIHAFFDAAADLRAATSVMRTAIRPDGMVWISWPKKASKLPTDITEDVIRAIVLPAGLVDVKVAAIDATWSGLKLMIRKELR